MTAELTIHDYIYLLNTSHDSFLSFTSVKRRSHKDLYPQRVLNSDLIYIWVPYSIPFHLFLGVYTASRQRNGLSGLCHSSFWTSMVIHPPSWCSVISPHNQDTVPGPLQLWRFFLLPAGMGVSDELPVVCPFAQAYSHPLIGLFHLRVSIRKVG